MILPVLLILFLGVVCNLLGLAVFETVAILLLGTSAFAFPIGKLVGLGFGTYLAIMVVLLGAAWGVQRARGKDLGWRSNYKELLPLGVWIGAYIVIHSFCLLWPDFISMGERLRDFALISSLIQHPLEAREPWMADGVLNYYLYWYRFGHFLSTMGGLKIWDTYHALQSFTLSLYLACFFQFFSKHLRFNPISAVASAALITLGSNISGIRWYALQDPNWWGPSRVIPGTINEFPAWSFLLGDLHPHFLNLPLLPLLVLVALAVFPILRSVITSVGGGEGRNTIAFRVLGGIGLAALGSVATVAWVFSANAWETPFVAITLVCLIAGTVLFWRRIPRDAPESSAWIVLAVAALLCFAIAGTAYKSSRNITPPGDPMRLVSLPIAPEFTAKTIISVAGLLRVKLEPPVPAAKGSSSYDLLKHWGFPLGLMALALVALSSSWLEASAKVIVLGFGYHSGSALILLTFIVILSLWRLLARWWQGTEISSGELCVELLGLAALFGIIFPEVIFVDDPYGASDERMNTVFKFYSAAWGFAHLYALGLGAEVLRRVPRLIASKEFFYGGWAVMLTLFLGFFLSSIKYRKTSEFTIEPYSQGLSGVERQFSGAGTTIQKLEKLPRGTVLEAQGGAYNFSSMISTLSSNEAFLGWSNHVGLLTRSYDEVGRRERVTKEFYTQQSCEDRKVFLQKEKIQYAVLGILERQNYGEIDPAGFACLTKVLEEGEYIVYSP